MNYITLLEVASGNEYVGTQRIVAKVFEGNARISEVVAWSKRQYGNKGRLMIVVDEEGAE